MNSSNICIIGAGSFGTALANSMALNRQNEILLYSIEPDVVSDINKNHENSKYLLHTRLCERISATAEIEDAMRCDMLMLAIPSRHVIDFVLKNKPVFEKAKLVINLAKGFGRDGKNIAEDLEENLTVAVGSLKGPSFASELINHTPTAFTFSSRDTLFFGEMMQVLKGTGLHLDFTTDIRGVEILSIAKNVYAIVLGIIDATFNSANSRFLVFTRAVNEIRSILKRFGADPETIFNYCGIGDLGLTALNDLSRNRTMGLFIGKGFFTGDLSESIVLEGKQALMTLASSVAPKGFNPEFPILCNLRRLLEGNISPGEFVSEIVSN
ncbi:MAG: NAD(P)-binding domain-containing protein [Fibrobacter sp.]|nr:NAD(P)-binding domain-containing protein [Fibrobacter sp.]